MYIQVNNPAGRHRVVTNLAENPEIYYKNVMSIF